MPDDQNTIDASVTHFFHLARAGKSLGAEELWKRYLPRLLGLARRTLRGRFAASLGPEDIVQSAFGTFWRRAQRGDFDQWNSRDDLWNLLAVITVRKVRQRARRELAGKRGAGKTGNETDLPGTNSGPFRLDEALATLPTAEFDVCCEEYLANLDEDTRAIVLLKLMGHTNAEVAALLGCSESTVERRLRIARKTWQRDDDSDEFRKSPQKP